MHPVHAGPGMSALVQRALQRFPDRVALRWDGGEMSYRATAELIGRMQAVLAAAGVNRGARVLLLAGNRADAWCASMAAMASGIAASWLNALASTDDHLHQLRDFSADVLIVDAPRHEARAAELVRLHADPLRVYTLGPASIGTDLMAACAGIGHHGMRDRSAPDDLSLVNYTGGTTGRGKGVLRDQISMAEVFRAVLASFELPARPCFLAAAPISHVAGTLVPPVLMRGGTVRLTDGFAPDRVLDILDREPVSATLLVPTMIYALLDHPGLARANLSRLETVLYGASPMAPSRLLEGLERIGPVFAQLYGQTEGYPLTYLARADHRLDEPELFSSCGAATEASSIVLLDEDNRPVATGENGELCVRGPHLMRGYLGQPALTDDALRDGWLHTGDMARCDDRGYLWLVDRKKDMIVSGGFNVYPREIEDVLAQDPAVAQVAVIGIPDPKWGEAVTAIVECRPGVAIDPGTLSARLVELVRTRKGSVLAPKRIEFMDALPRTPVGKIDKKALREPYWSAHSRRIG